MPSTARRESLKAADQLIAAPRLESVSSGPTILAREEGGPVPLSFAQERWWFLEQISPGDASGNISRAVMINGPVKQDLLQRAMQAIVTSLCEQLLPPISLIQSRTASRSH
jgi:hypothetical protein